MKEKVSIYIDGGNFYHLVLKKLGIQEVDFDFDGFARFLINGRDIGAMGKRYYVGTVREREGDEKSKESMARQTRLFSNLKTTKWEIKTSKLRERKEKLVIDSRVEDYKTLRMKGVDEVNYIKNREKGIDVKIVTDLFMGAFDKQYDVAIVVSSDTDLVPAIDVIRHRFKKKIEYIGFSIIDPKNKDNPTTPTLSLMKRTDIQRTLIESDIRSFVKTTLPLLALKK